METITHEGRTYTVTQTIKCGDALAADMAARGWTGEQFICESQPTGRQRKAMALLAFRNAKTGQLECVTRARA